MRKQNKSNDVIVLPNQIKQKRRAAFDHEYIDVYAINANSIDAEPVQVQFTQTRNLPFLYKLTT